MPSKLPAAGVALATIATSASSIAQIDPSAGPVAPVAGPQDSRAVEEREMPAPLSFDHIGREDGLPQGSVRAIVQDAQGFMWLGTEDGLARYDGYDMKVFRSREGDENSLLGGWVNALAVAPDGRIWVGTSSGVSVYDPATDSFTRLVHDPEDPTTVRPGGINDIYLGEDHAWLGRIQGGVDRVDLGTLEAEWFTEPPLDGTVTAIEADQSGTLWLGTDVGLIVMDPESGEATEFEPDNDAPHALAWTTVTTLYMDSAGALWVGSEEDGLFVLDPEGETFLRHAMHDSDDAQSLSGNNVGSVLEDRQKRIWICTRSGLTRYDRETETFYRYHHDPANPRGLPGAWLQAAFQDEGGVIWIGMTGNGVALLDDLRLSFAHHHISTSTLSVFEDPDGTIWAGTPSAGLYEFDHEANTKTIYRRLGASGAPDSIDLSRATIWGLHRLSDDPDVLWLGTTEHGLIRFNTETQEFKQYTSENSPGLTSDWIWDFWEAPDGMLWMATWGGGLVIFDPEREEFTAYGVEQLPGLSSDNLYTLYNDPMDPDLLWIGTGEGGLCRLDRATVTVNCFRHEEDDPESLSGNSVPGIYRAPGGELWVTTYGEGLNRIDPDTGRATHFNTENSSLKTDTLYSILPDEDGKLWLSSNNGLYHLDPETEEFTRYGQGDGLQSAEFALLGAREGRDGDLIFSGASGFNVFDPSEIKPDDYVPPVAITSFRSFDEDIPLDAPVWTLPEIDVAHTSSFEFEFSALSFADRESNEFAYKLEGFDSEWIEGRRFASYGRLGGGDYTLRVRAANRHGVWNEEGAAIDIHVTPAPWRTWWAYSLYGLVFLGGLAGYRRYNQQKLARLEQTSRLQAVERDLELTGAVQHGFLPSTNAVEEGRVRMYGFYRAAEACGGDWWWHEQPAPGIHHILVGDVTGHGPGPAMVTAAVGTAFRVQAGFQNRTLSEKIDTLNREVMLAGQGKYHMTLAAVEINESDGSITFYSAGSTPLLRLGQQGRARALPCRGTPLGTSSFELGKVHHQLEPGERILMFTDGIPEISISPDRLLGMRRFSKMFEQTRELGLEEATATIVSAADRLRGDQTQDDDWTLVVLEWG